MSRKQYSSSPPATALDKRPEWMLWLKLSRPQIVCRVVQRWAWSPTDEQVEDAMTRALAHVPGSDLGHADDGLPVIAAEALFELLAVEYPDGEEHVRIDRVRGKVIGRKALDEFEQRKRIGEGEVERRWERTGFGGLPIWVWRESAGAPRV